MRRIGVRQFKDEFYAQIKDLPLLVTSNKEPLIVVTKPESRSTVVTSNVVTPEVIKSKEEKVLNKCTVNGCENEGTISGTAKTPYGRRIDVKVCEEHVAQLKVSNGFKRDS